MAIFLSVLLIILKILGILLGVVILILILPVFAKGKGLFHLEGDLDQLQGTISSEGTLENGEIFSWDYDLDFSVRFLLGLFCFSMNKVQGPTLKILGARVSFGSGAKREKEKTRQTKAKCNGQDKTQKQGKEKVKKRKGISAKDIKSILASSSTRATALEGVKDIYNAMHADCQLALEFGLVDPAYTGMVYGLLSGLVGFFGIEKAVFCPRFDLQTADLSADFKASAWLIPAHVLFIALRFILDPEIKKIRHDKNAQPLGKES